MHCPSCRTEYQCGFSVCADCGTALEAGPVPTSLEREEVSPGPYGRLEAIDTVQVLHTSLLSEADLAAGLLQAEGIPARRLLWYPGGLNEMSLGGGGGWEGPWKCTVVVPVSFEREAREILASMGAVLEAQPPPPPPQSTGPTPFGASWHTLSEAVVVVTLALVLLGIIGFLLALRDR
jgi:hypothetical protein